MGERRTPLYFDRCIGTAIPEALRLLDMKHVYHHHIHRAKIGLPVERGKERLFPAEATDDEWMAFVAEKRWIVITQDYKLHLEPAVVSLIKQHGAKVFYLWGAEAPKFDAMRVFMQQHKKIVGLAAAKPGPFIYRVKARGPFDEVHL
ncbi:MAG: hypothetical protein ACT4P4_04670 [Betaproteobacteria bacterium]